MSAASINSQTLKQYIDSYQKIKRLREVQSMNRLGVNYHRFSRVEINSANLYTQFKERIAKISQAIATIPHQQLPFPLSKMIFQLTKVIDLVFRQLFKLQNKKNSIGVKSTTSINSGEGRSHRSSSKRMSSKRITKLEKVKSEPDLMKINMIPKIGVQQIKQSQLLTTIKNQQLTSINLSQLDKQKTPNTNQHYFEKNFETIKSIGHFHYQSKIAEVKRAGKQKMNTEKNKLSMKTIGDEQLQPQRQKNIGPKVKIKKVQSFVDQSLKSMPQQFLIKINTFDSIMQ